MFDILNVLIQSIQSIAVILIIIGMLIAFFWKVSFYINLGLGLIITILVMYLVNVVSGDTGLVLGVFLAGLIGSIIVALIGGFYACLKVSFCPRSAFGHFGYQPHPQAFFLLTH